MCTNAHIPNIQTLAPTWDFFFSPFGWWILWWAASSTRPPSHSQIFAVGCSQVCWALIGGLCWGTGCTQRLLCLHPAPLWWLRGWAGGRTATWQRPEVCPPSQAAGYPPHVERTKGPGCWALSTQVTRFSRFLYVFEEMTKYLGNSNTLAYFPLTSLTAAGTRFKGRELSRGFLLVCH